MKRILLLASILIFALNLFGQQKAESSAPKEQSKADKFSERSGSLISNEFIDLGNIGGSGLLGGSAKAQVVILTDLLKNEKLLALRFEKYTSKSYGGGTTSIATIDTDELSGLITSINYINEKIINTTPGNYTEVKYYSRDGFSAGCYYTSEKKDWVFFLKLEKYDSDSYVWLKQKDIPSLLEILNKAKTTMDAKI
ncbi:hypothetical protein NF867_03200 [Solitalea sp. MAHUQ-68]|uniref:DUF3805 domain-containing protein n=1 Tax=Solitalea agri TaxID=2953739 RepID=A0A9X2JDY7_9SPHI|nr:hypothetical protein [Solitalea agri]MCO4291866.1 hypothetical protein [Solitalea agri]